MLIKKNYNVKSLAETLEGALSVAIDDGEITVEIGLLEASEILDVLNETNKRKRCFGKSYGKRPIIICGTCKYAKRCEVLTKHE